MEALYSSTAAAVCVLAAASSLSAEASRTAADSTAAAVAASAESNFELSVAMSKLGNEALSCSPSLEAAVLDADNDDGAEEEDEDDDEEEAEGEKVAEVPAARLETSSLP